MAIVVRTVHGWLVDHRDLSELEVRQSNTNLEPPDIKVTSKLSSTQSPIPDQQQILKDSCGKSQRSQQWKLKKDLFCITTPFQMDSQFSAAKCHTGNHGTAAIRKRKRKRKEPLNKGEQLAASFHAQVKDGIMEAYDSIRQSARQCNYFVSSMSNSPSDNNITARNAATIHTSDLFADHCWETRNCDVISDVRYLNHSGDLGLWSKSGTRALLVKQKYLLLWNPWVDFDEITVPDVCNRIFRNNQCTSVRLNVESEKYLIPANSAFIMSDVPVFKKLCQGLGRFDLIVMDPPWHNKSVKRKKTYYSLKNEELLQLPLESLMNAGCLLAVWVTNRCKHIDFVKNQLFPRNNVKYIATWFWLKVTKTGQMVYDINSEHKRPYETLIIGRNIGSGKTIHDGSDIDENKVIVSVPCSLHSKKPPLLEILREYLPLDPSCLELFARNLTSNWTSWGNEVLVHQHIDFFEEIT